MKLFVWINIYSKWHEHVAFALAETPAKARELVLEKYGHNLDKMFKKQITETEPEEYTENIVFVMGGD